jgi:hypothetical protein
MFVHLLGLVCFVFILIGVWSWRADGWWFVVELWTLVFGFFFYLWYYSVWFSGRIAAGFFDEMHACTPLYGDRG